MEGTGLFFLGFYLANFGEFHTSTSFGEYGSPLGSSSQLIRLCGLAAVLTGVVFVASDLLDLTVTPAIDSGGFGADAFAQDNPDTLLILQAGLSLLAGVLLLFGSIGLYTHRSEEVGLLGLFGYVLAFSGTVAMNCSVISR